jgi:hypothetical protein
VVKISSDPGTRPLKQVARYRFLIFQHCSRVWSDTKFEGISDTMREMCDSNNVPDEKLGMKRSHKLGKKT